MICGRSQSWSLLQVLALVQVLVQVQVRSSPVSQNQTEEKPAPRSADASLHYNKYLQQVVLYLEKDPHFRQKLRNANISDITDGRLSQELDFVHHSVRTKLDELKREEINRLRMLLKAKRDLSRGHGRVKELLLKHFDHLDFSNNLFEVQDLDRLIRAASKDLQAVDRQQHESFKRYEMMKEHERRQRLKNMTHEEREREERRLEDRRVKRTQHAKVNQPGSEDQLKEVWHETDGLDQDFNPKTMFRLHDTNQDGFWDEDELEALFTKELEKVYDPQSSDDLMEMEEERLRMREHMIQKVDLDGDGLVSEQEFIQSTKMEDFHKNQEWETVDQAPFFSEQELREFEEHLSNEHQKIFSKTEELQKQKRELEEQQRALDSHREDLQQAWEQLDKLKHQPSSWKHEEVQESSPVPHPHF